MRRERGKEGGWMARWRSVFVGMVREDEGAEEQKVGTVSSLPRQCNAHCAGDIHPRQNLPYNNTSPFADSIPDKTSHTITPLPLLILNLNSEFQLLFPLGVEAGLYLYF